MAGIFVVEPAAVVHFDHLQVFITEQRAFLDTYVLANEISFEQGDIAQHFIFLVSEFPVAHHDINTEDIGCFHHVDTACPQ